MSGERLASGCQCSGVDAVSSGPGQLGERHRQIVDVGEAVYYEENASARGVGRARARTPRRPGPLQSEHPNRRDDEGTNEENETPMVARQRAVPGRSRLSLRHHVLIDTTHSSLKAGAGRGVRWRGLGEGVACIR